MRLRNRRVRPLAAAMLIPLVAGLAACGNGSGATEEPAGLVTEVLGWLSPAVVRADGVALITIGDVDRAEELLGLERPAPGEQHRDAQGEWLGALSGRPSASDDGERTDVAVALVPPRASIPTDFVLDGSSAGWSLLDVSRYVAVEGGGSFAVVFDGPLDDATLEERLGRGDDGVWEATDAGTSIAHRSGRTGVFVDDAHLRDWAGGSGSTLADDDTLGALGRGLDAQDVYGAAVYTGLGGFDNDDVRLGPFEGLAVGTSTDDDGAAVVSIVYAHADAELAAENAATLEDWLVHDEAGERYRELSPEPIEVVLDDDVVTVVFVDPEVGPMFGFQLLQRFDPLVMHRPD